MLSYDCPSARETALKHGFIDYMNPLLTHWGRVTHICVSTITMNGSDNGLAPSHYLNPYCNIVNWTLRSKLHLNLNGNLYIFIQKNAFVNVVWKMADILSWPQCVDCSWNYNKTKHRTKCVHIVCDILSMSSFSCRTHSEEKLILTNHISATMRMYSTRAINDVLLSWNKWIHQAARYGKLRENNTTKTRYSFA